MNLSALDPALLLPPFLAGLLILATHVPLGREVLARGIVFIDLAIAQIAALGVLAAQVWLHQPGPLQVQAAAAGAALLGALALTWTERRWPEVQEAVIGVAFVLASSLGLLLLAGNPHGGEHLHDLLAGQLLWVTPPALGWLALVTAALAAGLALSLPRRGASPGRLGFYALFALAVTASVQIAGVYLVFASLIVPALATRRLTARAALVRGGVLGAAGYALGLTASALFDLPAGATIVCFLALSGLTLLRLR
ncbi:MAG: metal ABC transporter permease [Betaproteobacteria bacterium]|nr:metal ABC transporter permease [Betaproteobacteria bacterium]